MDLSFDNQYTTTNCLMVMFENSTKLGQQEDMNLGVHNCV